MPCVSDEHDQINGISYLRPTARHAVKRTGFVGDEMRRYIQLQNCTVLHHDTRSNDIHVGQLSRVDLTRRIKSRRIRRSRRSPRQIEVTNNRSGSSDVSDFHGAVPE